VLTPARVGWQGVGHERTQNRVSDCAGILMPLVQSAGCIQCYKVSLHTAGLKRGNVISAVEMWRFDFERVQCPRCESRLTPRR